jgi:hypothetical protein
MSDRTTRLIGLGLLCLCAALAWYLHGSADRVGRNGPTLRELTIAILCFLSFSVGMAAVIAGVDLLLPPSTRLRVDKPAEREQRRGREERP